MAIDRINSINFLPEVLRTDKNQKFLSSTIDQFIQPTEIERINGYIGSKLSPTYNSTTDNYIPEVLEIRQNYQLNPALVIYDSRSDVTKAVGLDDLTDEIVAKGGFGNNLDRLYRSKTYSYNPHIDWDKISTYQQYYWLPAGPTTVEISSDQTIDILANIIGQQNYSFTYIDTLGNIQYAQFTNGLKIKFVTETLPSSYMDVEYVVEGVGDSIKLVKFHPESFLTDVPEYVTINRASQDLNPWSRYNRWFHHDVLTLSAVANRQVPNYPVSLRAKRPIVEFAVDIKLYNFGSVGVEAIDLIDNTNEYRSIEGSAGYYIDGVLLQSGHRVIFNADPDPLVKGKIWQVTFVSIDNQSILHLVETDDHSPATDSAVFVKLGDQFVDSCWRFNGTEWVYAQQRTAVNQAPLFDLFDGSGNSYADIAFHTTNFQGTKLFGYAVGSNTNVDSVLGFPLQYQNTNLVATYLFQNYFNTDTMVVVESETTSTSVPISQGFLKIGTGYQNVWTETETYQIPIIQVASTSSTTSTFSLTAIADPFNTEFDLKVFVDGIRTTEYTTSSVAGEFLVNLNSAVPTSSNVVFKITTDATPTVDGYYEPPLGLTNNPLNGPIGLMTYSELVDHINTMKERSGLASLRDIADPSKYGTRLIANDNPLAFAMLYIGDVENSVVNAITKVSDQYNQFKLAFLNQIKNIRPGTTPVDAVDQVMKVINLDKTAYSPYHFSDMVAYGQDKSSKSYTISSLNYLTFPLSNDFDLTALSLRSVLLYHNGTQMINGIDYEFMPIDSAVKILKSVNVGDIIRIDDYRDTTGSYVPATPTKLGLHPSYVPAIYTDDTYVTPCTVIRGHDGSTVVAYGDYRDDIILELELRIYNNIKTKYRPDLMDYNEVYPGAFRKTDYSLQEINSILEADFSRWAGYYGVDYATNEYFNQTDPLTWNLTGATIDTFDITVSGYWRGIYKYIYDTDRPHTCPWEMLGFSQQPDWWQDQYGPAPYTSGNIILWNDLEQGRIAQGEYAGINRLYARPGLSNIIPVDDFGNLVSPDVILVSIPPASLQSDYQFGDQAPVETSWRRSSYYPFALQKMLALTKPADYCAKMYDLSRMEKNAAGQWVYTGNQFLNVKDTQVFDDLGTLTAGYSEIVSEVGNQRNAGYISALKEDLTYLDMNLFYKAGGFISKNTMQVIIDAYSPTSTDPGSLLSPQDYDLFLNISNPVNSIALSGMIIQKIDTGYLLKGYDTKNPYFTINKPVHTNASYVINVGGKISPYVVWTPSSPLGQTTANEIAFTSASAAPTTNFYQQGQIVKYGNAFYRVVASHTAESTFNISLYAKMSSLPASGGVNLSVSNTFAKETTRVSYGTMFSSIQEIFDVIIGYGHYLESQGFVFDSYDSDYVTTLDWLHSGKEFAYWTTQNWSNNSTINLAPFSSQIKYSSNYSVIDDLFNPFYENSILRSDGTVFPKENISVNRNNGVFTLNTRNINDGIYFVKMNAVQKEHGMVFKNATSFNDVIFNQETGYRQLRMKLSGFRTTDWNGDLSSPGFVYDTAKIQDWKQYTRYIYGSVIRYNSQYFTAKKNIDGAEAFKTSDGWILLDQAPVAGLLPNIDYKITQFRDFYNLNIDNFDAGQEKMAQHLTGYTPRISLNNIFTDPIAQYKFYQGFIKEKGTKNSIDKLTKASIHNLLGQVEYTEEWAFRVGSYGSYSTYDEVEFPLIEGTFVENPQIISFVESVPEQTNSLINYITPSDLTISHKNMLSGILFSTSTAEQVFVLPTAGYARIDDVDSTAYNENSLLDIASNASINEGHTFWLGFKVNGDWDVLDYEKNQAGVIGVFVSSPGQSITFVTDRFHDFSVGDIVSVAKFNQQVNDIYRVIDIPRLDQFTVASTINAITNAVLPAPGLLYKFASRRFQDFDLIPPDRELLNLAHGTKFWIDDDGNGRWEVVEKIDNFSQKTFSASSIPTYQSLGYTISNRKGTDIVVVAAPSHSKNNNVGRIFVYKDDRSLFSYPINDNPDITKKYYDGQYAEFGASLVYDDINFNTSSYGLIFAGAPSAGHVVSSNTTGPSGTLRHSTGIGSASSFVQEGLLKISSILPTVAGQKEEYTLLSPYPQSYEKFGQSVFVPRSTSTKIMLVGAPGTATTGSGSVYKFNVDASASSILMSYVGTVAAPSVTQGDQWGYAISGSEDASVIAIGAPGTGVTQGYVKVIGPTVQTFYASDVGFDSGSSFGKTVSVSPLGDYVLIGAPEQRGIDQSYGKVAVFINTGTGFMLDQIIDNPVSGANMKFGQSIDINSASNALVISAIGYNRQIKTVFDQKRTTFDNTSTTFVGSKADSGSVYVYERKNSRFALADELLPDQYLPGNKYGNSVTIDDTKIYAGAPAEMQDNAITTATSIFYRFSKINQAHNSLNTIRQESDVVDITQFQKITLINTYTEEVVSYLDIIDPLKGKVSGIAQQELKYTSNIDPAVYTLGSSNVVVDTNTNWLDDHVGELWWDLSTVKFYWYEQGDLEYRRSNWGKIFPGASIDVYEWISSDLLPSDWATQADTSAGLTQGISGQPKFIDNSHISVKQIYNSTTNSFNNRYYYWVKNKIIVPVSPNRRISSYQVASVIADPTSYGQQFMNVLSSDSMALANVGNTLVGSRINLNVSTDKINNPINKHTEWLLLQAGSPISKPNALLEKKLLDSLLGHDALGNPVPDPSLSSRMAYGIEIRPRQSMFVNRKQALRNIIEFTNSILLENQITGNHSFENLNAEENPPAEYLNEWDQTVEDNTYLEFIDTGFLQTAELTATIDQGKVIGVSIIDPGYGYKVPPTITVSGPSKNQAILKPVLDSQGRIIDVSIEDPGFGYYAAPLLTVRSFTVLVLSDLSSNKKWALFSWNQALAQWVRIRTSSYDTKLYWNYVDWQSNDYNRFTDYSFTVDAVYNLYQLPSLAAGSYVKVLNAGDGNYMILEKIDPSSSAGTFDPDFNIVYRQNGTIQISDLVWQSINNQLGYDPSSGPAAYDQTLYDQSPDLEISYILKAIRDDIFIGDLAIHWNSLFFKAVKYALSEQKLLDWAFKTSFINVTNYAGTLDQRKVYKLQDSTYYQDYLSEVKPYHTQVRSYTTNYTTVDPSQTFNTDFDLPATYNTLTNSYQTVDINDPLMSTYPWKSWADNYKYSVGSIRVGIAGANYQQAPTVIITAAPGDTGSGATARAYISSGKVSSIEVVDPGQGYTKTPIVQLVSTTQGIVTATAYAQLINTKVRSNTVKLKFDRISRRPETPFDAVIDGWNCNGVDTNFRLTWLAQPEKSMIEVTIDGSLVSPADYTIEYKSETVDGATHHYCELAFLNYAPAYDKILVIEYAKSQSIFNAVERILLYYKPNVGMPGADLPQLMSGIEYPGTIVTGLSINYSSDWDQPLNPYDSFVYGDSVDTYLTVTLTQDAVAPTDQLIVSTSTGISIGQYINVISTTSNVWSTSTQVYVQAIYQNTLTVSHALTEDIQMGSILEIWTPNTGSYLLDSEITGGTFTDIASTSSDIVIDGGSPLITPETGFSPEELVAGDSSDNLAINVYTKVRDGAPVALNSYFAVEASTSSTIKHVNIPISSTASIMVMSGSYVYTYTPSISDLMSAPDQTKFYVDWAKNDIWIGSQTNSIFVGYTVIGIGGSGDFSGVGVIDSATSSTNSTTCQVQSLASIDSVHTASVYVNGSNPIPRRPSGFSDPSYQYYILGPVSDTNMRASATVYNVSSGTAVTAWFVGTGSTYFNEIREQDIVASQYLPPGVILDNADTMFSYYSYDLEYPPGNIEPLAEQTLVSVNDGSGWKILMPPYVTYYTVNNPAVTMYNIDPRGNFNYSTHTYNNFRVYLNGIVLNPVTDYTYTNGSGSVTIIAPLSQGDVIAIVDLPNLDDNLGAFDYDVMGSTLRLSADVATNPNLAIKVITYTDHDSMLIRNERFHGTPTKRFKLSYTPLDTNYVWVSVNGKPIINGIDYTILDDGRTIQLGENWHLTPADSIDTIGISNTRLSDESLGFRETVDAYGRTQYKRLSKHNSTYLTAPLGYTHTEIQVNSTFDLSVPQPNRSIPGVVLIDGERIEFTKMTPTTLSGLRRGTIGTSSKEVYLTNTTVIDNGYIETIPYADKTNTQVIFANSSTNIYEISTTSYTVSIPYNPDENIACNGIALSTLTDAVNQVSVIYGGRILAKSPRIVHDVSVSYYSPAYNSALNTTATASLLPVGDSVVGDAYIVQDTNQIWVQELSNETNSINGFVYRGLNYKEPEYYIVTATQHLVLNIPEAIQQNAKIMVVQRQVGTDAFWSWGTIDPLDNSKTKSLVDSTTTQALFLQAAPANLPDLNYYGGDVDNTSFTG
jgi:hypothetical protein